MVEQIVLNKEILEKIASNLVHDDAVWIILGNVLITSTGICEHQGNSGIILLDFTGEYTIVSCNDIKWSHFIYYFRTFNNLKNIIEYRNDEYSVYKDRVTQLIKNIFKHIDTYYENISDVELPEYLTAAILNNEKFKYEYTKLLLQK